MLPATRAPPRPPPPPPRLCHACAFLLVLRVQVRRDSCPAVAKLLEQSLRLMFSSRDLSKVS